MTLTFNPDDPVQHSFLLKYHQEKVAPVYSQVRAKLKEGMTLGKAHERAALMKCKPVEKHTDAEIAEITTPVVNERESECAEDYRAKYIVALWCLVLVIVLSTIWIVNLWNQKEMYRSASEGNTHASIVYSSPIQTGTGTVAIDPGPTEGQR